MVGYLVVARVGDCVAGQTSATILAKLRVGLRNSSLVPEVCAPVRRGLCNEPAPEWRWPGGLGVAPLPVVGSEEMTGSVNVGVVVGGTTVGVTCESLIESQVQ